MRIKTTVLILRRIHNNVGYVMLNRPEYMNAFNLELAEQFIRSMEIFRNDESVRVIVVKGVGKVFSAGGDVKEMLGDVERGIDRAAYFRAPLAAFGRMVQTVRETPKPVLAAVHGAVAGFAFNFMLACDLIIAEETTRFAQAFIKVGLSPDGGGTWFLPRLIGYARACELTMLPEGISTRTALDWGLINWVEPAGIFDDRVKERAERLVNSPAQAIGRTKKLLNQAFENSLTEHMEVERLAQIENAASPDFEEGLKAFVEKRKPSFTE